MIAADGKEYARLLLEESLSNAALSELERIVRKCLRDEAIEYAIDVELTNLANAIRAHHQHLVADARTRKAAPDVDPLLS